VPSLQLTWDRVPRFVLLLVAIIAELMVAPLFTGSIAGLDATRIVTGLLLLAALSAVGVRPATLLLFVPAIALHLLGAYWGSTAIHLEETALRAVFFSYALGLIIWHVLHRPEVTIDTIAGAACAYMLLAVVWAHLYLIVEVLHPGSFIIPARWEAAPTADPAQALLYFSFITLTTVGYGDITPGWAGAAGLVAAEAVVGQLYLAVTIARLVGLHISRRT